MTFIIIVLIVRVDVAGQPLQFITRMYLKFYSITGTPALAMLRAHSIMTLTFCVRIHESDIDTNGNVNPSTMSCTMS